ncbi:SDR family oxidoreductase [Kocuria marina]|uniref:SDR family oxidoreductase n=1 Tax=Kocuria marina TaxID=223184 RepID=UPI0022E69729|nr:SDR family oxidoreductase [Kocuria marina]
MPTTDVAAPRVYVVTGAGSGIGQATAAQLIDEGHRVIGVDLKNTEVVADLSTEDGIAAMVEEISALTSVVDGVIANAGTSLQAPMDVAINFFGAVGTVEGLLPLLRASDAPRVCITASAASLHPANDDLVDAMLNGDRETAAAIGERLVAAGGGAGYLNYSSSKQAVARWVRRNALAERFVGAGITLNAVAPGLVLTPMTEPLLATEEGRRQVEEGMPSPLNGPARPEDVAAAICFLTSTAAGKIGGQVLFVDSGYDALTRGDDSW